MIPDPKFKSLRYDFLDQGGLGTCTPYSTAVWTGGSQNLSRKAEDNDVYLRCAVHVAEENISNRGDFKKVSSKGNQSPEMDYYT